MNKRTKKPEWEIRLERYQEAHEKRMAGFETDHEKRLAKYQADHELRMAEWDKRMAESDKRFEEFKATMYGYHVRAESDMLSIREDLQEVAKNMKVLTRLYKRDNGKQK
jgi:hypothetical protein